MTLTPTCHTRAKFVYGFYIVVFSWCQINLILWLKSTQVSLTSNLQRQLALLFSYFITYMNSLFSGFPSYIAQVFPQLVTYKIWHSCNGCAAGGVFSLNFESVLNSCRPRISSGEKTQQSFHVQECVMNMNARKKRSVFARADPESFQTYG